MKKRSWRITQLIQEANGQLSSTRIILLFWAFIPLAIWGILSWKAAEIKPIPAELVTLILGLVAGKVTQKFGETGTPAAEAPVTEAPATEAAP